MKEYYVRKKRTGILLCLFAFAVLLAWMPYTKAKAESTPNYLAFTAEEDGSTISFDYKSGTNVQYSTDGGATWSNYEKGETLSLNRAGDTICFKGKKVKTSYTQHFRMNGRIAASGSVTSLTDENGGDSNVTLTDYCYQQMFADCKSLTSAPELPATKMAKYCYEDMFYNCTNLTSAPELPATTLGYYCYMCMFRGCESLTSAPELPATTLAGGCYYGMFSKCTSLTNAPELPATTLAIYCYINMFGGCTSLTSAPELPATTLDHQCYFGMFSGCTSLTKAPELPATTLADSCYAGMFSGCTSLTNAPELPVTTLAGSCYASMFSDCTSLTSAPVLPATTLVYQCYGNMFSGCTSLTSAPELPATTLAVSCYAGMFQGCTSLTSAPELPVTTLAKYCYSEMFLRCTGLTSAPELPATTMAEGCYYGMFRETSLISTPMLPATTLADYCYKEMFKGCYKLDISTKKDGGQEWGIPTPKTQSEINTVLIEWNSNMFLNCPNVNFDENGSKEPQFGVTYYQRISGASEEEQKPEEKPEETYAIIYSKPLWKAGLEYLNEMYIEKAPNLGLRVRYGSKSDQEVLKKVSEIVTQDAKTQAEKAMAIAKWTGEYLQYKSYQEGGFSYYPIDAFYSKVGNCLTSSILMVELMRMKGIPAVTVTGMRGNMEKFITIDQVEPDHAWVMAYYDQSWHLYDPLFDVYGNDDIEFWSTWYYIDQMEGITPYSTQVDYAGLKKMPQWTIMYMDGHVRGCINGKIAEQSITAARLLNNCVSYWGAARYFDEKGTQDGYRYMDNPERREELLFQELYHDGWICSGPEDTDSKCYAQENGIRLSNGFIEKDGVLYFLSFSGDALVVPEEKKDCTLWDGYIVYELEKKAKLPMAEWMFEYINNNGESLDGSHHLVFEIENDELATVDKEGNIIGHQEGLCNITAYEMSNKGSGWSEATIIQVVLTNQKRTPDYSSVLIQNQPENQPQFTPENNYDGEKDYSYTIPVSEAGTKVDSFQGMNFYEDSKGEKRCYKDNGVPVVNEFTCDGTNTYYFQQDGTCMKDRLTYHPDGEHVIYFDENGHEVFSSFANVKKTIAGEEVNDFCFFDVYGHLYVDVVTFDQTGTKLYYANQYGVMEKGKWFEFSDTCKWADGKPFDKAGGKYGYAMEDGSLMTNTATYDWEGRLCYMQGNGVAKY